MVEHVTSRVSAIVFVDMVGSTEVLTQIGTNATIALRRTIDGILRGAISDNGGEVVDTNGDGVMAAFPSCSDAIQAGMTIHRDVAAYSHRADAIARFAMRIGIAVGDVSVERGDYFGEVVVAAARLESLAGPGETLVTDTVRALAQRHSAVDFEEVGPSLLKGLPAPVTVHRVVNTADQQLAPLPTALDVGPRFPLVGRDREMAALLARWEASTAGELNLAFAVGEPGIGKTRLVAELAKGLHRDGALVLYGSCEAELAIPYRPFAKALVGARHLDNELGLTLDGHPSRLAPLFPSEAAAPTADLGEIDRLKLFESVADLLVRLANIRPVVLVLDDLHWAISSTVLLLRYLLLDAPDCRLLIVGTYREEEVGRDHALRQLLADLHRRQRAELVAVDRLVEHDVVELLESEAGGALADEVRSFARRIHRESNGSPLFAGERIRHMEATGVLTRTSGRWAIAGSVDALPVPDSVREVVGHRVARLGGDVAKLISNAAVIGQDFDLDLLAEVSQRPLVEVIDLVELAGQAALVDEGDRPGRYSFVHAVVRSSLLDELSATRRAVLHQRIAETLERLSGDRIDELAYHWQFVLGAADRFKAVQYLVLAAKRDAAALAWEAAIDRYRTVLGFFDQFPDTDPAVRAEAWLGLGRALRALGDAGYRETMEEAARLSRRAGRADLMAGAVLGCMKPGTWFTNAGGTDPAILDWCDDALAMLGPEDPLRVLVLANLATNLSFDADRDRKRAIVGEAEQLARSLGDPDLIAAAIGAEYLAMWDPHSFERRCAIATELQHIARRTGNPEISFLGGFFQAFCRLEAADLEGARDQIDRLARPLAETRSFWFRYLVERLELAMEVMFGTPGLGPAIDALFERALETQADAGATWACHHGGLAIQSGTLGDLLEPLSRMAAKRSHQGIWHYALAMAHIQRGEVDEAAALVDQLEEPGLDFFWMVSVQMLAGVGFDLGRADICADTLPQLLPFRGRLGVLASGTLCFELVSTSIGRAALGTGDLDLAREVLTEAVATADRIGAPYFAASSRRLLARALIEGSPDLDLAGRLLDEVERLAAEHGFPRERAAAAELRERLAPA